MKNGNVNNYEMVKEEDFIIAVAIRTKLRKEVVNYIKI